MLNAELFFFITLLAHVKKLCRVRLDFFVTESGLPFSVADGLLQFILKRWEARKIDPCFLDFCSLSLSRYATWQLVVPTIFTLSWSGSLMNSIHLITVLVHSHINNITARKIILSTIGCVVHSFFYAFRSYSLLRLGVKEQEENYLVLLLLHPCSGLYRRRLAVEGTVLIGCWTACRGMQGFSFASLLCCRCTTYDIVSYQSYFLLIFNNYNIILLE